MAAVSPGFASSISTRKDAGGRYERHGNENADIVAYTDVDLSTDLNALLPLVVSRVSGDADIAIGSRLTRGARVDRGPKRELISRAYNRLLPPLFATQVRDAQCGFKALRAYIAAAMFRD